MENKKLFVITDKIMRLMHNIVTRISDITQQEIDGNTFIDKSKDKQLTVMFSVLSDTYIELEDEIGEEFEQQKEILEDSGYKILTYEIGKTVEKIEYADFIKDLKEYIMNTYTRYRYINPNDLDVNFQNTDSIYENSKFQNLRMAEYEILQFNFDYTLERLNIYDCEELLSFYNGNVISDTLETMCSEYAVKRYKNKINEYKKANDLDEDIKTDAIQMLYTKKSELELFKLNSQYNGILGKTAREKLKIIREAKENGDLNIILGMTKEEMKAYTQLTLDEYKSTLKDIFSKYKTEINILEEAKKSGFKYKSNMVTYDQKVDCATEYLVVKKGLMANNIYPSSNEQQNYDEQEIGD